MKLDSKILSHLFDSLNTLNAKYCVMNKYKDLPEIIETDVDMAIDKDSFRKLDSLLRKIALKYNVGIVQKIWHGYNKCAYILSPLTIDRSFRLQLDFFTDYSVRGYPNLIPCEIMLASRIKYRNFFVPSPEIEVPFLIMRRITKNDFNITHARELNLLVKMNPSETLQYLRQILGFGLTGNILQLLESGNFKTFTENINSYRKMLKKWSNINTSVFYRIKYTFSQAIRTYNRLFHPVGFSVVFLGPDGCGKSTVAKLVLDRVSGSFHGGMIQYWRPCLLPPIGRLKFWNPSEEISENPRPHDHPRQNPLKSFIRFFYYLTDYCVGYPIKIYRQKIKKQIIIFDRYYYDYLVDIQRYQFTIPFWLPRVIMPLVPSPDMIIYLDAEPDELRRRKQELSNSELERQVREFRSILSGLPKAYQVATDRSVEDIVKEIAHLILSAKTAQTHQILGHARSELH